MAGTNVGWLERTTSGVLRLVNNPSMAQQVRRLPLIRRSAPRRWPRPGSCH